MSHSGRVLLVDDDPKVLRLLEATLRLKEYDVIKMESGVEALAWLKRQAPDLIISDIMMPDLDGYDFFRRVRSMTRATAVPFIFLSARSEPEDVVRGLRLGADEFLRKPFSIDELLVRVERVLERVQVSDSVDSAFASGARGVFEGDLEHMALADVLRMLCVQRQTGVLRVEPAGIRGAAALQIKEGHVVHGELGVMSGEAALFQLLMYERGRFSFRLGEDLPDETIEAQTLPLLMEAFRLMDMGVLRRIDPLNEGAAIAISRLISDRRAEVQPLPPIADLEEPSTPLGMPGLALRLTKGRPPPGVDTSVDVSIDDSDDGESDFSETVQLDSRDFLFGSGEQPAFRDALDADVPMTDIGTAGRNGPDTWERAGLLVESHPGIPLDDPDSSVGLDSIELAPAFVTSELEAIESEYGLDEPTSPAQPPLGSPSVMDDTEPRDERSVEDFVPTVDPDASGRIIVNQVKAIALVEDTAYQTPVVEMEVPASSDQLMDLYEALKVAARSQLKTREIQMGTRSGRVIASAIRDESRRGTVAAFSAQAIAFATEGPTGLQFAVLDAGDLHVVVIEVDHLRLFTVLFDRKPDPVAVLDAVRPVVDEWRQRTGRDTRW